MLAWPRVRKLLWKCLFWWGFWTLIGLAYASQLYLNSYTRGQPVAWSEVITWSLQNWYVWMVLAWPISWLARRYSFNREQWFRSLLVQLPASVAFVMLYIYLRAWVGGFESWVGSQPVSFLIVYWEIVGAVHAIDYYRKFAQGEARAAELKRQLAQAQLQALQMQLNPHFLFNTLNSISALIHRDVEAADRMITQFGDLLRRALSAEKEPEVTLKREMAFLQDYLEIEKTRFGERLAVKLDIPVETEAAVVPNLILQPLVENAIRHGIAPHARAGVVEIRAARSNGTLVLEVLDNGAGIDMDTPLKESIGLSNTRARLRQLYGERHEFTLANRPEGGLGVRMVIPFKTAGVTTVEPVYEHTSVDHR
ncbi:MAG: histidine kinase [Verrucomicrobiota bacterium]